MPDMEVRIGILETNKLIELEVDDPTAFKKEISEAVENGGLAWFTDTKGRSVGFSPNKVAFVEMEDADAKTAVGFAPSF